MHNPRKHIKYKCFTSPYHFPNNILKVNQWIPKHDSASESIPSNSWFDISVRNNPNPDRLKVLTLTYPVIPKESYLQQLRSIKMKAGNKKKANSKTNRKTSKNIPIKKPVFMRCKKVRLYPNQKQKDILHKWFDLFNKMFNITVEHLRRNFRVHKNCDFQQIKKDTSFYNIRSVLFNKKTQLVQSLDKNKIKVHLLDEAIKLASANFRTSLENYRCGRINKFRIREWKMSKRRLILHIEPSSFSNGTFFKKDLGMFQSSRPLTNIKSTCILQYDRDTKKYILFVPSGIKERERLSLKNRCGVDLGIRTFASVYSDNESYSICNNSIKNKHILKNYKKIDLINSLIDTRKTDPNQVNKKRKDLIYALRKYYRKTENKVTDMHYKTCRLLVTNFREIYIGKLSTKNILSRNNKTLSKENKRLVGSLAPSKFRSRLQYMGNKYGCRVIEVGEYLTSKTCSNCGFLNNVGASKIYKCERCQQQSDRDENGAKNILKKGLVERAVKGRL